MDMENRNIEVQERCELIYNTQRKKMSLPEYGRSVQKMVDYLKTIEDKDKRTEQAKAVIKVMELVNPSVHLQENYEQKLWDHLHIIADFELDVDSPYPLPERTELDSKPLRVPYKGSPIKATHYGRNIQSIMELIIEQKEEDVRNYLIRQLAIYMRQQYLIWNKDTVADETIFRDIEKLSDNRIKVPEGMTLSKVSGDMSYNRPGQQNNGQKRNKNKNRQKNNRK